jgi:hypothetical protein
VLSHNHCLDSFDSLLESMQFRDQTPQRLACQCRYNGGVGILQQVDEIDDAVPSRRCNDAELPEVAAQCIDQHGPLPDQQVAHAMMQEPGLLSRRLHRHETHARPANRLTDRLCIRSISLAATNVRFDV